MVDAGSTREEVEDLAHVTMTLRGLTVSELYVSENGEEWRHVDTISRRSRVGHA